MHVRYACKSCYRQLWLVLLILLHGSMESRAEDWTSHANPRPLLTENVDGLFYPVAGDYGNLPPVVVFDCHPS
ncbi:hypothetical protein VFPBJ_11174 [Purpureocillium lilacinum]|uniref:Uncharacterized protein n=1 Tax=Purpureocillium lilacinum TaxID=33203 RepID=A0A179FJC5_PURLI|nr:hypothetical protein VFPBJ_11174 [Purpureocillium lilacinum]